MRVPTRWPIWEIEQSRQGKAREHVCVQRSQFRNSYSYFSSDRMLLSKDRRGLAGNEVTLCSGETLSPNYPSTWNRRPTVMEARRTLVCVVAY